MFCFINIGHGAENTVQVQCENVFNGDGGVQKFRILSEIFSKIYFKQLNSYCDSFPIGVRLNDFARFCQGRVIHSMIP